MFQIQPFSYPQNHQQRKDKQGLQFYRKSRAVKPHAGPGTVLQHEICAAKNQQSINNIALRPDRRVQDHRREKKKNPIRQMSLFRASCTLFHDPRDHRSPDQLQQTAQSFKSRHGIDRKQCDQIQNIHNRRRIIIEISCKGFETIGLQLRQPGAPIGTPVVRHKRPD